MRKKINRKGLDDLLESTPEMNATARMVLMSYARTMQYVEEVQPTWQKQETVANFAGVSEDTLVDYTKALVGDGFLILVREEKLGNNKVKRFYALGKGTITNKLLKRRERNKGASNLVPGAKHKKAEDKPLGTTHELEEAEKGNDQSKSLGTTQKPPMGTTQNRLLGGTETNTKPFTKGKTVQPSADSVADAPSQEPQENEDREDLDLDGSLISSENKKTGEARKTEPSFILKNMRGASPISQNEASSLISSTTEEAASGSNPETRAVLDNVQVTPVLHVKDLDGNYSYFVKHSPERGEARLLGIEWEFDSHLRIPGWSERQALRAAKKKAGVSA